MNRITAWLILSAILVGFLILWTVEAASTPLPPGAPVVTSQEWRLIGSRFMRIKRQGSNSAYVLLAERYLDSTSVNEAELRYDIGPEGRQLMAILWGLAASDRWDHFYVDRGYIVCVNKQHVIPAEPKLVGVWYDMDGPEAKACRTLSEAS